MKTIDLKTDVIQICFHYDETAPHVSKRIGIKDKDESRFDIYVKKPFTRTYMLRVDE